MLIVYATKVTDGFSHSILQGHRVKPVTFFKKLKLKYKPWTELSKKRDGRKKESSL